MRGKKRGCIEGGGDVRDPAAAEPILVAERCTPSDLDSHVSSLPEIVRRFLERPGAVLHGEFTYSVDDSSKLIELRRKRPEGHLVVEMDNWPDKPRVWYIASEPIKEFGSWGSSEYGLPDVAYPITDTRKSA